jgi:hypothetical protein
MNSPWFSGSAGRASCEVGLRSAVDPVRTLAARVRVSQEERCCIPASDGLYDETVFTGLRGGAGGVWRRAGGIVSAGNRSTSRGAGDARVHGLALEIGGGPLRGTEGAKTNRRSERCNRVKTPYTNDGWERIVQIDASDQILWVGVSADMVVFCTTRFPRHTW